MACEYIDKDSIVPRCRLTQTECKFSSDGSQHQDECALKAVLKQ